MAPFDGVVTKRLVNPGDLVQAATSTRTDPAVHAARNSTWCGCSPTRRRRASAGIRPGLPSRRRALRAGRYHRPRHRHPHRDRARSCNAHDAGRNRPAEPRREAGAGDVCAGDAGRLSRSRWTRRKSQRLIERERETRREHDASAGTWGRRHFVPLAGEWMRRTLSSLQLSHPSVAPATQPTASLKVDAIANSDRCIVASWRWTCRQLLVSRWRATSTSRRRSSASKLRAARTRAAWARSFPPLLPTSPRAASEGALANPSGGARAGDLQEFHSSGRDKLDHQSRAGGVRRCRVETAARGFGAAGAGGGAGDGACLRRCSITISCWPRRRSPWPGRRWTRPRSCSA